MPERSDFWSRRRRAVAREERREDAAAEEVRAGAEAQALDERSDDEILQALGLPDPDTLTPADAARFMAREIPARLRRRAIRALFRAHPHLSPPDGLQDYDDDYTDAAVNVRPDASGWAGLRDRAAKALERKVEAEAEAPEEAPHAEAAPEAEPQTAPDDPPAMAMAEDMAEDEEPEEASPLPRRMTFHFKEDSR